MAERKTNLLRAPVRVHIILCGMIMKLHLNHVAGTMYVNLFHNPTFNFKRGNEVDFNNNALPFIPRGGGRNDDNGDNGDFSDDPQTEKYDEQICNDEVSLPPKYQEPQSLSETMTHTANVHFMYKRHLTRSDERAILGRAVLTTPHRRMPAIRIAAGPKPPFISPTNPGPMMTATPIFVTKFSLCESLGCALRDLRVIDQFSTNERYSGPAFLARSNCVIVNVGHVRAIVMRDQVLIFLPEQTNGSRGNNGNESINVDAASRNVRNTNKMTETIECLVEALVTHLNSIYHSSYSLKFGEEIRGQSTEWAPQSMVKNTNPPHKRDQKRRLLRKNQEGKSSQDTQAIMGTTSIPTAPAPPFELVVIEALLGHVCSFESSKVTKLIQAAKDVLEGIAHNFSSDREVGKKKDAFIEMQAKLGELLPLKNKVDELEAKCAEVAGAIAEVLKNDEDMAAMRLSEKNDEMVLVGDPKNLHVEVELLFEDYLLQMDEVLLSLRSVQNSVRNTEEVVEIELDLLRNRIMRYEMLLELSGLVVGVGAAVTGAFGMNLVNHVEEHPNMFWSVSAGLIVFMAAIGYGVLRKLSSDNIL
jgi:Mg2+ and Co2+ transporter CorA